MPARHRQQPRTDQEGKAGGCVSDTLQAKIRAAVQPAAQMNTLSNI
jgi:hypothetical protein